MSNLPAKQKNLLTARWRTVKAPKPSELQIQISIIDYLKIMVAPGVVYFHVPNGELRDKRTAAKLKAMGVLPGVADLVFIRRAGWSLDLLPEILFLEVKAHGQKQTPEQMAFEQAAGYCGAHYAVACSLDEAINILQDRGMVRPRAWATNRRSSTSIDSLSAEET